MTRCPKCGKPTTRFALVDGKYLHAIEEHPNGGFRITSKPGEPETVARPLNLTAGFGNFRRHNPSKFTAQPVAPGTRFVLHAEICTPLPINQEQSNVR